MPSDEDDKTNNLNLKESKKLNQEKLSLYLKTIGHSLEKEFKPIKGLRNISNESRDNKVY